MTKDKLEWRYGMQLRRLSDGQRLVCIGQWRSGETAGPVCRWPGTLRQENLSPTEVEVLK